MHYLRFILMRHPLSFNVTGNAVIIVFLSLLLMLSNGNAQTVRGNMAQKRINKTETIAGQMPCHFQKGNWRAQTKSACFSAKIVETEKGQECWVKGPLGTAKVATFPKGANVSITLPSELSGKAGWAKVANDTTSQPAQTVGLKLRVPMRILEHIIILRHRLMEPPSLWTAFTNRGLPPLPEREP